MATLNKTTVKLSSIPEASGGPASLAFIGSITRCLSSAHKDDWPSRWPRRSERQGCLQAAVRLAQPCLTALEESEAESIYFDLCC